MKRNIEEWIISVDMSDPLEYSHTIIEKKPLVRCRDCKYYLHSNEKCELIDTRLHFYQTYNIWTENSFCAWGEKVVSE